eukprot:1543232-Rhodomonas_salina.1
MRCALSGFRSNALSSAAQIEAWRRHARSITAAGFRQWRASVDTAKLIDQVRQESGKGSARRMLWQWHRLRCLSYQTHCAGLVRMDVYFHTAPSTSAVRTKDCKKPERCALATPCVRRLERPCHGASGDGTKAADGLGAAGEDHALESSAGVAASGAGQADAVEHSGSRHPQDRTRQVEGCGTGVATLGHQAAREEGVDAGAADARGAAPRERMGVCAGDGRVAEGGAREEGPAEEDGRDADEAMGGRWMRCVEEMAAADAGNSYHGAGGGVCKLSAGVLEGPEGSICVARHVSEWSAASRDDEGASRGGSGVCAGRKVVCGVAEDGRAIR